MTITKLRESLEQVRSHVEAGDTDKALHKIAATLRELDEGRLLTTTEAAALLGIRSVNTLKLLLRLEQIPTVRRGNRTMIALGEIEKIQNSERVRGIRASDAAHDATEELGVRDGLSPAQLEDLEATRPGTLPWKA
jgi:hypothetical protein